MAQQNVTMHCRGLYTFQNILGEIPDGALSETNNVVIDRDGVVTPRRGNNFYGTSLGTASDTAKQLILYKDRILRHWDTTVDVDSDGQGDFVILDSAAVSKGVITTSDAVVTEPTLGTRIKYVEASGNLYFTSSTGIRKFSSLTDANLSSTLITQAGGIQALDTVAVIDPTQGWLPGDSVVAYRIVWGIQDQNTNVVLGVPSERVVVSNPQINTMITDYNTLISELNATSGVTLNPTGTTTGGSNIITVMSSTVGIKVGATITGSRIPGSTTVIGVGLNQITISNNVTGSGAVAGVALTISPAFTATFSNANPTSGIDLYNSLLALATSINGGGSQLDNALYGNQTKSITSIQNTTEANTITITSNTVANPTVVTPSVGLISGDIITISNSNSTPSIDGSFAVTVSGGSFTVPVNVTVAGTYGTYIQPQFENVSTTTITTSSSHGFTTGDSIIISGSNSTPSIDGTYAVTVISSTQFTIPTTVTDPGTTGFAIESTFATFQSIPVTPATLTDNPATTGELDSLQNYFDAIVNALNTKINETYANSTQTQTVDITFTIPQEITTAYFYQIYRSSIFTSGPTQSLEEFLSFGGPDDELRLIQEGNPTLTDLTNQYITFHDTVPDSIRAGGANLYTNANSGAGIDQAYYPPPLAQDVAFFLGSTFYANTTTKQHLEVDMLTTIGLLGNTFVISNGTTSFTYTFASSEDVQQIEVFNDATPSQSISDTAQSMTRVINKTINGLVYVDYTSGPNDLPGEMLLTARNFGDPPFYIYSTSPAVTEAFNPMQLNTLAIGTGVSAANPTVITSTGHGLTNGTLITVLTSNSTPVISGQYVISNVTTNTFTIPVNVTVAGTSISYVSGTINESANEVVPNRLYYSVFQQPDAVPLVNYIDVGFKNKAIIRILPLRTSLYILTQSGIYILTGTDASNFTVTLFDSSAIIKAPDSAVVLNNQIFCLTTQGVCSIGDTGVNVLSRPIENLIVPLLTAQYTNFIPATFAVSYESDRAYLLFTLVNTSDTTATVCYRWNTFTSTWTSWNISKTCGVVNTTNDLLYLGAADTNYIEQERKSFTRQDNADRSFIITLPYGGINGDIMNLGALFSTTVGDVFSQVQYLTINQFNRLLYRLDSDSGLVYKNYFNKYQALPGDDLYNDLANLAVQLDMESGEGTTYATIVAGYTPDFPSVQEAFNAVVTQLNMDVNTNIKTYKQSSGTTTFESYVTNINLITTQITLNYSPPFIAGDIIQSVHIESSITWAPHHFGDPSMMKQISEATMLFENLDFSDASMGFASDLSPGINSVNIIGQGNGVWGDFPWGTGYFGGQGSSVPFRTFVPTNQQVCRYISGSFTHETALEQYAIFGISFTYTPISSRGYR